MQHEPGTIRTVIIRILPDKHQRQVLRKTLKQHTSCFNYVAAYGFKLREKNPVSLHHETYYPLRKSYPLLPSQLVISARNKAAEAVKSLMTHEKNGDKVSCPHSNGNMIPIRYDRRTFTFNAEECFISLATVEKRQKIRFKMNDYIKQYLEQADFYSYGELIYRKHKFYFHLSINVILPKFKSNHQTLGVDLGINHPAVTSDNQFIGDPKWKGVQNRYFKLRRGLQAKGTKSAKRHLRRISGKSQRFRRYCDHVISRRIVDSVASGTVIALENLTGIRKRVKHRRKTSTKRKFHEWSFKQLAGFIAYKALAKGCKVELVDPRNTSRTCSRCGFVSRRNRQTQAKFLCKHCGFELNADLNAARNIADKHHGPHGRSVRSKPRPSLTGPSSRISGISRQPRAGGS